MKQVEIKPEHWEQARKDFPEDEMMAEIHAIRIAINEATQNMTPEERRRFYQERRTDHDAA